RRSAFVPRLALTAIGPPSTDERGLSKSHHLGYIAVLESIGYESTGWPLPDAHVQLCIWRSRLMALRKHKAVAALALRATAIATAGAAAAALIGLLGVTPAGATPELAVIGGNVSSWKPSH